MNDTRDLFSPDTRADQILARFKEFHALNPHVWSLFEMYSNRLIAAGHDHYGAAAIIERIRWDINVEAKSIDEVKINNDFRAYYSRMFRYKYPQHAQFFSLRRRRSSDHAAFDTDIPILNHGPIGDEAALEMQLRALIT